MSVDGVEFIFCWLCRRHTATLTYWDASMPNRLDERCMECTDHHYDRFINLANWVLPELAVHQ